MRRIVPALLVSIVVLPMGPLAAPDLNGPWTISFNTPMGSVDATATFKVDGDKLSGTMASQAGEVAFTGTVKGLAFTVSFEVQTANGNFTITMNGEQDGDSMQGTFDFGQGTGDFAGSRKK